MYNKITVKDYPLTIPQNGGRRNEREKEKPQPGHRAETDNPDYGDPKPH